MLPNGRPLHPALAAVQTPGREYYILRDNGMQVGCEEEGVALVWMGLLGCDALGRPNPSALDSYWLSSQYRNVELTTRNSSAKDHKILMRVLQILCDVITNGKQGELIQ